ncbi:FG-GAP-like repeat-containing protein [Mucilaginibacter sp. SJ]|uniref:FG-GAP-like repeat-containing protein n=1 Tax=Mucilaginibacter sp. SJ TaxID=3029053 RepID=UPI0023A96572|nr:FG-GAP-like repeat-containing protein [Mucilaginibacter sp. SJ]WEA00590.1 FG-GAP-like repeat-containing protein [Mucilaginibacter sp. SJ]
MRKKLLLGYAMLCCTALHAQSPDSKTHSKGFPVFPAITNTLIPGAPLLGQPILINGTEQEIRTEKHGLVYPSFFDWNHDGKTDMLLGEFETGETGSDIKVYLNIGTNKKPKYSGKFFYAKDIKGDTITNNQWCCIGIHPRIVDLNKDGYPDIISGQYDPGLISWWEGSPKGFLPRRFVPQEAYKENAKLSLSERDQLDPNSRNYWIYSSAGFGDFNGDGLPDLFVGGMGELRVALNVGTKDDPKFGMRKFLLGLDGLPLSVVPPSARDVERAKKEFRFPNFSGVIKSFITPVDWDGDGVLDLLVTHIYGDTTTKDPVVFFRGISTDKGLRFEKAKPLFTAEQAKKTFPGCQPNICVTDYNNDGIPDLVIGISLPTVNGFNIDSTVSWSYYQELGIEYPGKDAGEQIQYAGGLDKLIKRAETEPGMKRYFLGKLEDYKYLTLRHRGYVYVMLGKKNPQKAVLQTGVIAHEEEKAPLNENSTSKSDGPVSYMVKTPGVMRLMQEGTIEVKFSFKKGWYGYANTKGNIAAGWIPTDVKFDLPDGMEAVGPIVMPEKQFKGVTEVYKGDSVIFFQKIRLKGKSKTGNTRIGNEYMVGVTVQYQTCNEEMCLPPVVERNELKVNTAW